VNSSKPIEILMLSKYIVTIVGNVMYLIFIPRCFYLTVSFYFRCNNVLLLGVIASLRKENSSVRLVDRGSTITLCLVLFYQTRLANHVKHLTVNMPDLKNTVVTATSVSKKLQDTKQIDRVSLFL